MSTAEAAPPRPPRAELHITPAAGAPGVPRTRAFPDGFVERPALVQRLVDARDAALALIVAPPGYGKSALLAEWAQHDQRPFLWPALDDGAGDRAELTARLVRCVRSQREQFVVVLDDADALAPAVIGDAVESLLRELPDGCTVALALRTEPELPVGRLRAHRMLVEVRMRDLAMTGPEAETLLRRAGVELERESVDDLVAHTEGWPAALYLAALSLSIDADGACTGDEFRGDDHLLAEFVRDDVLSAVPPDLMDFLIRSSILDELSGTICDAVLERQGSARALEDLAGLTQLLVPLDRAHERYRWQRLLVEALRVELRRTDPAAERRLHRRASDWYRQRGDTHRAIVHAVAACDAERTSRVLWPQILSYLTRGRTGTVARWLDAFSDDEIARHCTLALSAALTWLVSGDMHRAQHWALVAAEAVDRDAEPEQAHPVATGLSVIESAAARVGALQMRDVARRAYELELESSPWRGVLCLLVGLGEYLVGECERAAPMLEEGVERSAAAEPAIAALCLAVSAMIAMEQADWDEALERAERAGGMIAEAGLERCPMSALVFAASAAARAHQGHADEAKRDLRTGIDALATLGDFAAWYGALARMLLAHASLWLADIVGARTLLAEASRLARRTPGATIFDHWFNDAWAYMDTLAEQSLAGPSSLTIAELRILRFLPSHRSFREIAEQLGVSANTVKTQAHAAYRKLGAASRSEAVARASEAGLLGQ